MNRFSLLMRRVAGFTRRLVGGRSAKRRLRELQRVDISSYVRRITSDAVLLNETPSPTDGEKQRMDFIMGRLREFGISNIIIDGVGNVAALFPAFGTRTDFLLVCAEVGDGAFSPLENSVHLVKDRAEGRGLGERSLGAAALLVFAEFAQATGFHLDKNLLLLFSPSPSIDANADAFRSFLSEWAPQISGAIFLRGTGLGVVESRPIGTYKLDVEIRVQERELLATAGSASAAIVLGAIAFQVGAITWDARHSTVVNLARIESGIGFGHWPSEGRMDIEILSDDEHVLETTKNVVSATIEKIAAGYQATVELNVRSHSSVGDVAKNAPLGDALRAALARLRIKPEDGIISEQVSLLNELGIPGVALGVTRGKQTFEEDWVELGPLALGFRQLLLVAEQIAVRSEPRGVEIE